MMPQPAIKVGDRVVIKMFPPLKPIGTFHVEILAFTPGMELKVKFNNNQEMVFPLEYIDDLYVQLVEDKTMPEETKPKGCGDIAFDLSIGKTIKDVKFLQPNLATFFFTDGESLGLPTFRGGMKEYGTIISDVLKESQVFCMACAKGEHIVVPPRSGIVGRAAVHSSGMICIPNTIRALIKERLDERGHKDTSSDLTNPSQN